MTHFRSIFLAALLATWPTGSAHAQQVPQSAEQVRLSYAPVVKKVVPAVVNIYTRRLEQVRLSPLMDDPVFQRFFGGNFPGGIGGIPRERVVSSLGSGVIIKPEGMIVTSSHVIKGAQDIRVVLADKREFTATVTAADEQTDLALLRINTSGQLFPALTIRDSDSLEVGDLVLAIGNPFGVGQTVTGGIISALSRSAQGVSDYQFFIQTDAAINPGNSGGALVDMDGRLIGINTAIYSRSGGYQGIGFAIPANMVSAFIAGVNKEGKVVRPWLGAGVQDITPPMAESLGLPVPKGVVVAKVTTSSPAAKSGLKTGDVILSVGGAVIENKRELNYRTAISPLDKPVPFEILRQGTTKIVEIALVPPPQTKLQTRLLKGRHPLNGLEVADLSPELAEELGLESDEGVVVVGNQGRGNFGIVAGDIILDVNGASIASAAQLEKLLAQGGNQWRINVARGKAKMTLLVTP